MKILCVADERRVAQAAANALRGIAPNVTLTWAEALSPALHWVQHNRDAAAVIVEAEVRGQSCRPLVDHVRGLGLTTPIVVVVPQHFRPPLPYFGTDDVVSDEALPEALPPVITRALQRVHAAGPSAATPSPPPAVGRFGRPNATTGDPDGRGAVEAGVPPAAATSGELTQRLAQEMARRAALEQDLATAESARRCAEQRHAGELAEATARHAEERAQHERALTRNTRICTALQEQLLELEAAVRHADEHRASEAARFAEAETQREKVLTRTTRVCAALQERLLELEAALRNAGEQRASQAAAAADHLAQRHAEFTASLKQSAQSRDSLAQRLSAAIAALEEVRQARVSDAAAAGERLAARESELGGALAEAVAARTALERAQAEAEASHQQAQQRAASELAAAAERQAALENQLTQEVAARTLVAESLGRAESAREESERRHASELAVASARLADVQSQYTAAVDQAGAARVAFEQQLTDVTAALAEVRQAGATEAAAATERLAAREAELGAALADAVAAWTELERVQAEAAAHQQDMAVAAERHAVLEDRFTQEVAARTAVEDGLDRAERARREAEQRHASELAFASARLADLQAQFDAAVEQAGAARAAVEQQLTDVTAAFEEARRIGATQAAAAAERHAAREAELGGALADAIAGRTALERAQAEAAALHEREREHLKRDLAETRAASARIRRRFLGLAAGIRRRTHDRRTRLDEQFNRERQELQRALQAREEELRRAEQQRDSVQSSLDQVQQDLHRLYEIRDDEHRRHERARLASESELQRMSADYDRARQSLDQLRAAFDTLEHVASEHAAERARLESVVADRDEQLNAHAARQLAAAQAAGATLAQVQEDLRLAHDTRTRDTGRLQREIDALRRELEDSRAEGEALRNAAGRVPALLQQLDESDKDNRRQFERAPYGMCRCGLDGALMRANHALVRLLEYRSADELQAVDFAKAVFESPADLRWLIERAVSAGTTDWVETAWKTRARRSLVVRLRLRAVADRWVDVDVENVTGLRAAEEKLRQAQRMEAVGRLASEVAGTCGTLLRDVGRDGQQWLAAIGSDTALRQQGELLLAEVTRAAGLLRQLAVYGDTQVRNLEPVDVGQVLHDVAPVLKRVAGDDVELVLAKAPMPIDVDVDAERIERVLVNVAMYARQRMPRGGRLKFDLTTTMADSRFVAAYPNVRPGAHALITVTEMREDIRSSLPLGLRTGPAAADVSESASDGPGVDLGVLVRLLDGCGGHLWMMAEPPGNMTLKIYLPMRAGELVESAAPARPDRGRSLINWFRH